MHQLLNMIILVILIGTSLYTISYGVWTWEKNNKLGAIMIFIIALTVMVFPLYTLFFRFG